MTFAAIYQIQHRGFMPQTQIGFVSLVGAGPGDIGLLTLRAQERLRAADVIYYDYLACSLLLDLAGPQAERIHVGKRAGAKCIPQEAIQDLLVLDARAGKRVVRLKGGDPFLFGRGGEEASRLAQEGIPFEVVPGVTSAFAVPAYAGIPVTDRRASSSVLIATGHEDPLRADRRVLWEQAAQGADTLVILMGTRHLAAICQELVACGRAAETPAAAVTWGTTARQRRVVATLGTLADAVLATGLRSPSVVVVGRVVALSDELCTFEALPLFGCRVVLTRDVDAGLEMAMELVERGAEATLVPTISFEWTLDSPVVARAIEQIRSYDWIVLTSANAVSAFFAALDGAGLDARALGRASVAAIGPATAEALGRRGIRPDVVPSAHRAEGVVQALRAVGSLDGARVLIPRAEVAREVLVDSLTSEGALVDVVAVYRNVPPPADRVGELAVRLANDDVDLIVIMSSSSAQQLVALLGGPDVATPLLQRTALAAIGPVTAHALDELGLSADIVAESATTRSMLDAMERWWKESGGAQKRAAGMAVIEEGT